MLLTSRKSYQLVYLAAAAGQGCPAVVSSAGTCAVSSSPFQPFTRAAHRLADAEAVAAKVC